MDIASFDELQAQMLRFTEELSMNLRGREHDMITAKHQHQVLLHNLKTEEAKLRKKAGELAAAETAVRAKLNDRADQVRVKREKLAELEAKQKQLMETKASLSKDVSELLRSVEEVNNTLKLSDDQERIQFEKDGVAIIKYETYLGIKVREVDRKLRLDFDLDGEFWIEISWNPEFALLTTPALPDDEVKVLSDLILSGEFVKFLKTARAAFILL